MARKMDKGKTSQQGMEESGTEQISPQGKSNGGANQEVSRTRGLDKRQMAQHTDTKKR